MLPTPLAVLTLFLPAHSFVHRPPPPDAWWWALDTPSTSAPADGMLVLKTSPRGRVRIPGGSFTMGSTRSAMARALDLCRREVHGPLCGEDGILAMVNAEGVAHAVTLSTFELDRTEVTVSDYARCVSARSCAPADIAPADARFALPDFPVTHVRWDDAAAYCHWADGRLPTEAEWEYGARGTEGRQFPWGNLYNTHLANHGAWADDPLDSTDGFAWLAPIASFPDGATPLGLQDMAGNAAEWVADVFEFDGAGLAVPYDGSPEIDPKPKSAQVNVPSGTGGAFHVVRGGSYSDGAMWLRSAARATSASPRNPGVGFRCAADAR